MDWKNSTSEGATSVEIKYRKTSEQSSADKTVNVDSQVIGQAGTKNIDSLEGGTEYTFSIRAKKGEIYSEPATATGTPKKELIVAPVTGAKATATSVDNQLKIDWKNSVTEGATSVDIKYRKTSEQPSADKTITVDGQVPKQAGTRNIDSLEGGTEYTVTIIAKASGKQSTPVTVKGTPKKKEVIAPVTGLKAAATGVNGQLKIDWTNSVTEGATSVEIKYRKSTEQTSADKTVTVDGQLAGKPGTKNIDGLEGGQAYTITVVAKKGSLQSESATASGTPKSA